MKYGFFLLIAAIILQNYLFYNQNFGINFLALNVLVLTLLLVRNRDYLKQRNTQLASLGSVLCGMTIAFYGGDTSIFLYIFSILLLIGYNSIAQLSPYVSAFNGFVSFIGIASFNAGANWLTKADTPTNQRRFSKQIQLLLPPLAITLCFYGLYYWANPNFSFLSTTYTLDAGYLFLFLVGLTWIPALIFPYSPNAFTESDLSRPNTLKRIRTRFKGHLLQLKWEYRQGVIMLVMLNSLLAIFLVVELQSLYSGSKAQSAYELSQSVHDGINVLIISILLAITLILFYFRKNLNFFPNNQTLVKQAYTWIGLNILLLAVTTHTNSLYVQNYGLTYKRIGVYIWLLLTGLGLFTTLLKIHQKKTNAYLFRVNSWITYFVFILMVAMPWAKIITHYNLNYSRSLDLSYLFSLHPSNLPQLQAYSETHPGLEDKLSFAVESFQKRYERYPDAWQSWNYSDWKLYQHLTSHPLKK
ncbi:DUF4173 domain-containing protein [Siphonobacter sp. SORGH_AS_1065]|uniref:DUF4153 domain-containing protein n=1 Tax=Siphonobacter sp. SORGH_AS_1065 TaxID=3041795 RepID=UPI002780CBEA|nr:DUF4173 domain-containing protein [Siphonobacter sp. SORGH_AS_1065]MDQ1085727.1 hypothetical protein [Siphonobacter sp. SORGH_AS_1065]